ncbi:propionyl-CoA synthetase [Lacihabitans soyangensis]|uniref:Propionyl-CoA synthetase n=1 Tax=Lacihabitans soyangensis TaxID=869394 RepID=A0AAE3H3H0_9BACT|nr:propionyl-CoA synthetase [Lacihabitans soyangensis]MCP9764073.1 propionyl-CoA synthetase [Lacihabitans soyangensis]
MEYNHFYQQSILQRGKFWGRKAAKIAWYKAPKTVLTLDKQGYYKWYPDGELNTCYLAVDKHVKDGKGGEVAMIYDSPVSNTKRKYTYDEVKLRVSKISGALRDKGVEKGDTVIIYMPMVPDAAFSMLACARLGAVHSVVFGGFAPHELAIRIDDAKPKVIISASCGIEFDKIIPYKPLLENAIQEAEHQPSACLILQREMHICSLQEGFDFDFEESVNAAEPADCVKVNATDPLYILYTSGTTGKPKGIVRDNGGHAVAMQFSMDYVYNAKKGDVFWAASDVGWVVGHSYIVYAPLIAGCTTVFFEGKPVRTPDPGTFWRMIEEYKVNIFFTAPTAFRAIRKEDPESEYLKKYDLSSLRTIFVAGERCDPSTLKWLQEITQKPIIDHWWQTETGWAIVANMMGVEQFPVKEGSATKPVCGYEVQILDETGEVLGPNQEGFVCIKEPLPPGCLPTLWNDDERFQESYMEKFPGYYLTGDGGYIDPDGYVFIMGRIDDVINVAGHRLSTGEMEEIVSSHTAVAECAVIGIEDELTGQKPLGLVVLKDTSTISGEEVQQDLVALVRAQVGAVAAFRTVVIVKRLPKTRSGKILRKTMRMIADDKVFTLPSTIDDPAILEELKVILQNNYIGLVSKKQF